MASNAPQTPKMKYKRLGNTGLRVSEICLGAMNFGWSKLPYEYLSYFLATNEETSFKILDQFVELGGNFIDTADVR